MNNILSGPGKLMVHGTLFFLLCMAATWFLYHILIFMLLYQTLGVK